MALLCIIYFINAELYSVLQIYAFDDVYNVCKLTLKSSSMLVFLYSKNITFISKLNLKNYKTIFALFIHLY